MQRDKTVDIAKGIAILLVIVGHQGDIGTVSHFIYSFHMPLFFIIGGYFFNEKGIMSEIKTSFSRLVCPYLLACTIYLCWYVIFGIKYHSINMVMRALKCAIFGSGAYHGDVLWGEFPTIGMIWFLLALFWCRIVYSVIANYAPHNKYLIAGTVALSATLIDNYIINLPWAILPGLSAIMFFMLGNLYRNNKEQINKHKTLFIVVGTFCWFMAVFYGGTSMVSCRYVMYPIDVIGACGATYWILWISRHICSTSDKASSFMAWIGINSMTILVAHFVEQSTFLWQHLHIPENWYIILPIRFTFVFAFMVFAYRIRFVRSILVLKSYDG